jgi:hypothetical protein
LAPGVVLKHNPPAGYRVGRQTMVTLDVSKVTVTAP